MLILASLMMSPALHADGLSVVHVFAAGSLQAAFNEIGIGFQGATGIRLENDFGPSGVLRERIEKGEQPDLFASADMGIVPAERVRLFCSLATGSVHWCVRDWR